MIDARTIQMLADAEAEKMRTTPVLSQHQLNAAIARTRPAPPPDVAAEVQAAIREAIALGERRGEQAGIDAGIVAGRVAERLFGRGR